MNVVICDDERLYSESIAAMIREWSAIQNCEHSVTVRTYTSTEDLLEDWQNGLCIDMLFLDIQIPREMSGMTLAKVLHTKNEYMPIVFVTNFSEFVYEGYSVRALRYLLKPVRYDDVAECMEIVWRHWQLMQRDAVQIDCQGQILQIPASSMMYLEARLHTIDIHTTDTAEIYKVKTSLAKIKQLLPSELFVQCHRSYIVNLMYVRYYKNGEIHLSDGNRIAATRKYLHDFLYRFRTYYTGGETK